MLHELTTQVPHEVDVAIERGKKNGVIPVLPQPAQPPTYPEPTVAAASPTQDPEPATVRRQPDSRIPWRDLLLRVFRQDVLARPCGARRKVLAFINERSVIEQILGHVGLPTTGPPIAQLAWQRTPSRCSGRTTSPSCSNRCADGPVRATP